MTRRPLVLGTQKRVFVVRDTKTGLYSTGGYVPSWVGLEKAKTYASPQAVASQLKLYAREQTKIPSTWEVLELEVTHNQKWSSNAREFLRARQR